MDPIDPKKTWCSTKVDSDGVHVNGIDNYGFCSDDCDQYQDSNQGPQTDDNLQCKSELFL